MDTGFIVLAVALVLIGAITGFWFGKRRSERQYANDTRFIQGVLNVDRSDPEFGTGLYLNLGIETDELATRKYVALTVQVFDEDSRR